jgi:hypothetical protein
MTTNDCQTDETLDQWLTRMDRAKPVSKNRQAKVNWVVDGHGKLLDPDKDVLDDVAMRQLERE